MKVATASKMNDIFAIRPSSLTLIWSIGKPEAEECCGRLISSLTVRLMGCMKATTLGVSRTCSAISLGKN